MMIEMSVLKTEYLYYKFTSCLILFDKVLVVVDTAKYKTMKGDRYIRVFLLMNRTAVNT